MTRFIPIPLRLVDSALYQLHAFHGLLAVYGADDRIRATRRRLVKYVIDQLERRRDQAAGKGERQ